MLFETFPKLKLRLHFEQNMLTLNKLILGYVDLTDCCKICQKHSGDNDEQFINRCWEILMFKIFFL